jgi:hypothetical protein
MSAFADALADAGGLHAPRERGAQLKDLLAQELKRGHDELQKPRSGYGDPLIVAIAPGLVAAAPLPAALRADPNIVDEKAWLLAAAITGALVECGGAPVNAGAAGDFLTLGAPAGDAELAALAFDENIARVDRLRAVARAVPAWLVDPGELKPPIGERHPLVIAQALAGLGANPADPQATEDHEEALLAALPEPRTATRPHDDPDPRRRVARRILQRLNGMGKWGGYHTEFSHLARGFAGNDRALADEVGEALIKAELLLEKPSVGQRHVFLNPRRAGDIHALIDHGTVPGDLEVEDSRA